MATNGIPVLDLKRFESADPAVVAAAARELDDICREIGFLVISNHGVSEEIQDALYDAARAFFDLPLEAKMTVRRPHHDQNRGYIPYGEETLARMHGGDTPPDFKEVFAIGPFDRPDDRYHSEELSYPNFAPNLWPSAPPALEPAMRAYFLALEDLSRRLARHLALALGLPDDWFADKLDRHASQLRLLHYPAPSRELEPGQLRCGVHTDLGMMTILRNEAAAGGLQVRPRGERLDRRARRRRHLHRQHRRPADAVDQRSVGVDPASRCGTGSRGPFPLAPAFDRLLHAAELRRPDRVHQHLHRCREPGALRPHHRQGLQRPAFRPRCRPPPNRRGNLTSAKGRPAPERPGRGRRGRGRSGAVVGVAVKEGPGPPELLGDDDSHEGVGEGEAGERPGEVGPLPALGGESVRPAGEEGGVPPVRHPRLEPLGEVRGGPGGAPFVERHDPRPVRHGPKEPLAFAPDRCGGSRALARGCSAIRGRYLPDGEPAGGGKAFRVVLERLVHPSRHPGPDRRQHDLQLSLRHSDASRQ